MSHKKFGPDRFSRFDVYWIQTDRQTDKPNLYVEETFKNHQLFGVKKLYILIFIHSWSHKYIKGRYHSKSDIPHYNWKTCRFLLLYCRLCGYPNVSLHPWKSKSDESQVANREYTNGKLNPRKVTAPHPVCNSNHTHRIQNLRFASHIFNPFAPRGHKLRIWKR